MTETTPAGPYPLDHLVLPTASLDLARTRLTLLGFIVAPTGVHPFGTENCCVLFADGTYLESLAIGNAHAAANAIAEGNVFVARDRIYRDNQGQDGFSAIALRTGNAEADHRRYVETGLSAGDMLSFSRAFTDAAGKSDTASFKLAFASSGATGTFLFACERINAPEVDRTALQAHANGVTGILEILAVSDRPSEQRRSISIAARNPTTAEQGSSTTFRLPNTTLTLLDPAAFEMRFGIAASPPSELRLAAIVFSVCSAAIVARQLAAGSIDYDMRDRDIVVRPAPGQGAAFIFREIA
jgi:hypothetical protein